MKVNTLFEDDLSEQLRKQVFEVSNYINQELDKRIIKQLFLRLLDKKLLPILVYPEREQRNVMPMWYSSGPREVTIHTPVPEVRILTWDEAVILFESIDTTNRLFENLREAVEKLE
jgi:hypothetical protein